VSRDELGEFHIHRAVQQGVSSALSGSLPTLRDQFAMAALSGVMAGYGMGFDDAAISAAAYIIADAMMKERAG
jgi:hypothetical protein